MQSSSKTYQTPIRRYTLNVFDMKNKFNSNTEKQISRNRFSLNSNNKRDSKVSNSWILAKNKIIETTKYMKSGPGFGPDFGFVSIQELVKVRVLRDIEKYIYSCSNTINFKKTRVFCKFYLCCFIR